MYEFTQSLYNEFFCGFNNMWVERGMTDFMQVNTMLEEFMETRAKIIFKDQFFESDTLTNIVLYNGYIIFFKDDVYNYNSFNIIY